MVLSNPKWADEAQTQIDATLENGEVIRLNAVPGLLHYDELVASGVAIAPFAPEASSSISPEQALKAVAAMLKLSDDQTAALFKYAAAQ